MVVRKSGASFFTSVSRPQLVPELVILPILCAINLGWKVQIAVFGALVVRALSRPKIAKPIGDSFTHLPAIAYAGVIALTFRDGPYRLVLVFGAVYIILSVLSSAVPRQSAYDSMIAGLGVYIGANILGWAAGMRSPVASGRLGGYETTSPFFSERIAFPFAASINEPPYIAAALFVAIIAMIKMRCRPTWYHWLGLAGASFVILAANNRSVAAIMGLLAGAILLAPRFARKVAPYAVSVTALIPFYFGPLQPIFSGVATFLSGSSFLLRSGSEIGTLESRSYTWSGLIRLWTERFPGIPSFLFGYGYHGHVKSGAYLFIPRENSIFLSDRTYLHAHNSALQVSLDAGLVGMALLVGVVFVVVYRYGLHSGLLPVFAAVTTIASAGITESSLAPGISVVTSSIFLYATFFTPARRSDTRHQTEASSLSLDITGR